MEEVLVFQHDPFEDLGFFAEVLEKQGCGLSSCSFVSRRNAGGGMGTCKRADRSRRADERR